MNGSIRSRTGWGLALVLALMWTGTTALAQMQRPAAGGKSDVIRIRKLHTPEKIKTPVFKTAIQGQASARRPDWWHVVVEYETKPDWIDELEFTFYTYIEDQSNKGAPVMFRATVTYVNIRKGRHMADVFLHPNTVERMGPVKQIAVVVKHLGAVAATESTATKANWWDGFPPVDGVLLNRWQTPFEVIDYDLYEAIKPATAGR